MIASRNRAYRLLFANAPLLQGLAWLAILLTLLPAGASGSWSASMVHRVLIGGPDDSSERPVGEDDDDEERDADQHKEKAAKKRRLRHGQSVRHVSPVWLAQRVPSHSSCAGHSPTPRTSYASGQSLPLRC